MVTLASSFNPKAEVYNSREWKDKREEYAAYKDTFDGEELDDVTGQKDPVTGDDILRYPLQLNPAKKVCKIHRAVMLGMRDDSSSLPIQTIVKGSVGSREEQLKLQGFIGSVLKWSDGASMIEEACLLMQVYGGHFFKVSWEFWNKRLPTRIAIRSLKSPAWCLPVYDIYDPWNLLEAWIGYEIPKETAEAKFAVPISSEKEKVLYLEHWTPSSWKTTVDGKVPSVKVDGKTYPLEGDNPWGLVPVVYIPHDRAGGFYGKSLIENIDGLVRELNAREADLGDAVREQTHRELVGSNVRSKGTVKMRKIVDSQNKAIDEFIDIGERTPLQNAGDPKLEALDNPNVPTAVTEFPAQIWDEIRRECDIASVAMGDDDVSGGRITGPVTAYRMWPTISHTMTERSDFSTGLTYLARIAATIAVEREASKQYEKFEVEPPGITEEMLLMDLKHTWHPMIPIEKTQKTELLNARLQAGGISLQSYLDQLGEDDIEEEIGRIWEDYEKKADIDAKMKQQNMPQPQQGGSNNA